MHLMHPLWSALLRQRLMPALVVLQITCAGAILVNVLFLFWQQLAPMLVTDGVADGEVLVVDQLIERGGQWNAAQTDAGTRALLAIPGVRAVAPSIGVPMRQTISFELDVTGPTGVQARASVFAGRGLLEALGLHLVQGRDFSAEEHFDFDLSAERPGHTPVILTEALAHRLFPDGDALGRQLGETGDTHRQTVVGVVRHLLRYQVGELDDGRAEHALIMPARITGTPVLAYVVRAAPARRAEVERAVHEVLQQQFGASLLEGVPPVVASYEHLRALALKPRRAALWLLGAVALTVLLITTVGIGSLSAYWVEQRTRQIGIRRALGATRRQILRHFQCENLVLTSMALALALPLAATANLLLMRVHALPRLPATWLAIGALVLLMLGQLAVLGPARRAAAVPPAVATRSA